MSKSQKELVLDQVGFSTLNIIYTNVTLIKKVMDRHTIKMIDELLSRLEHMEEMENLEQLQHLRKERQMLLNDIELYDRALDEVEDLCSAIVDIISFLQGAQHRRDQVHKRADSEWLLYWGIKPKKPEP